MENKKLSNLMTSIDYRIINMRATFPQEISKKIEKINNENKLLFWDLKALRFNVNQGIYLREEIFIKELKKYEKMVISFEKRKRI